MGSRLKKYLSLLLALLFSLSALPPAALADEAQPAETELTEQNQTEDVPQEEEASSAGADAAESAGETGDVSAPVDETSGTDIGTETAAAEEDAAAEDNTAAAEEDAAAGEDETAAAEEDASAAEDDSAAGESEPAAGEDETESGEEILELSPVEETLTFDDELPGNDELFAGYIDDILYESVDGASGMDGSASVAASYAKDVGSSRLEGANKSCYKVLKSYVAQVADGTLTNTVFTVTAEEMDTEEMDISGKLWTAADLGVSTLAENNKLTSAAYAALNEAIGFDLTTIMYALLADCPYELYWFDKTSGMRCSLQPTSGSTGGSSGVGVAYIKFYFYVAAEYSAAGSAGTCVANTAAVIDTVNTARRNAAAIVQDYASLPDSDKLAAYREAICGLVSYSSDYADYLKKYGYGSPWQLIWVFDGDSSTNVVCEGYAKAFQYLCDLSEFSSKGVCCYCVTGYLGSVSDDNAHMWNIVTMDDGRNYLVDVTNCDVGTIGYPDYFFLAAAAGSETQTVTITASDGTTTTEDWPAYYYITNRYGGTTAYIYNSDALSTYTRGDLTLSGLAYGMVEKNGLQYKITKYYSGSVKTGAEAVVSGYTDALSETVTIPSYINSIKVTGIGDYAFQNCTAMTSVTIPATVTAIGAEAFSGCTGLQKATFLGTAPTIADDAFSALTTAVYYYGSKSGWSSAAGNSYSGTAVTWTQITSAGVSAPYSGTGGAVLTAQKTTDIVSSGLAELNNVSSTVKYVAYDISLTQDGKTIQPDGSVTVSIETPLGYNGDKCTVYYVDSNGSLTDMEASYADGVLSFTTFHFSTYVVAQPVSNSLKKGDVDGDGSVTVSDAMLTLQAAVELVDLITPETAAADVDGDKSVTISDATIIARYYLGKYNETWE